MLNKLTFIIIFSILTLTVLKGQVTKSASYSNTEIPANGFISIFGSHDFTDLGESNSIVFTNRGDSRSYLNFIGSAQWNEASKEGYVDGFVKVYHDRPFVFPIGNNNDYRPVGISGGMEISAAYADANPNMIESIDNTLSKELLELSDHGYWEIDGRSSTHLTLTWNHDTDIDHLIGKDLKNLTIAAYNGSEWVAIPSVLEEEQLDITKSEMGFTKKSTNADIGAISTKSIIVPSNYEYFTLASTGSDLLSSNPFRMSVYPNPAVENNNITVDFSLSTGDGEVLIAKMGEDPIYKEKIQNLTNGKLRMSTNTLESGVYWVILADSDGQKTYKKLIILDAASVR